MTRRESRRDVDAGAHRRPRTWGRRDLGDRGRWISRSRPRSRTRCSSRCAAWWNGGPLAGAPPREPRTRSHGRALQGGRAGDRGRATRPARGEASTALATETARLRAGCWLRSQLWSPSEEAVAALPVTAAAAAHDEDPLAVATALRAGRSARTRLAAATHRGATEGGPLADRGPRSASRRLLRVATGVDEAALSATNPATPPERRADDWLLEHHAEVARYRQVVGDIETAGTLDLAALAVARRALQLAGID